MRFKCILRYVTTAFALASFSPLLVHGAEKSTTNRLPYGVMEPGLVEVGYKGTEKFHYSVSYTGGVTLGHLELSIQQENKEVENYAIRAHVSTDGSVFDLVYPINDSYLTHVQGPERLPISYTVTQKEGWGYQARRLTIYDQATGEITYRKNEKAPKPYTVQVPVHNEFSAFFASRLMNFTIGKSFLVPTFADKKRVEVEVKILGREKLKTSLFGEVSTIKVAPVMKFKGLYDKEGDTTIWYTADECRVPVRINSKIAIGSITAELTSYENPLCPLYNLSQNEQ